MSHGCDRRRAKTLSRKFDKWECIWCGAKQTVAKGTEPDADCQRDLHIKDMEPKDG
jgi:hypothetical protein